MCQIILLCWMILRGLRLPTITPHKPVSAIADCNNGKPRSDYRAWSQGTAGAVEVEAGPQKPNRRLQTARLRLR